MQYNATSFHPELTQHQAQGEAFAERMNALLLEADSKENAPRLAFAEIGAVLIRHGYRVYWGRARLLLWAALRYRADAYEHGLEDALERIGCLLEKHGYMEGWTIFSLEIRPWLCWPDTF